MSLLHTFAMNVRYHRNRQDISQEDLASMTGLHRTYISAVERERRNISIENIEKIAVALSVKAYDLFIEPTERK